MTDKIQGLTARELADGALAALANAEALFAEARLLSEAGHYARAWALTHFSMEELAKVPMLIRVGTDVALGRQVDWKKLNRRFRDHGKKVRQNAMIDYVFIDETRFDNSDVTKLADTISRVPDDVSLRNASLYVDWDGTQFVAPSDVFALEAVEAFGSVVEQRLRVFRESLPQIAAGIEDVGPGFHRIADLVQALEDEGNSEGNKPRRDQPRRRIR